MKKVFVFVLVVVLSLSISVSAFAWNPGQYRTNYDWMNTRSGAGLGYSVTGQLPRNSTVSINEISGNWGKMSNGSWIRLDSGFTTYLGGSSNSSINNSSTNSGYKTGIFKVLYNGTNIRSGAGLSHSVVTMVNSGTQIEVTQVSGEWGYIPSLNGWLRLNGFADYVGSSNDYVPEAQVPSSVTANQADAIVAKAAGEVGYLETTYANGDFWSKYGQWYGLPYSPWCAMFVSWAARHAGAGISEEVIPNFASCGAGVNYFKNNGRWVGKTTTPSKGDIIFFSSNGYSPYHVGIVESLVGNTVCTIEGNVHDGSGYNYGVRRLSYNINDWRILGYARPSYK